MLIGHLHIFFYKMRVQIFGHFSAGYFPIIINKFWELFLYSWYKSFIRYLFCKHFTQSVTCPFILTVYFKKQKILILSVVYQCFFSFMPHALRLCPKKFYLPQDWKDFLLFFSVVHLKWIFVWHEVSIFFSFLFFFLHMDIQLS